MIGFEIQVESPVARERAARALTARQDETWLVLNTCQRLECFGFSTPEVPVSRQWEHAEAFERLVRIAAGLESRILGELEVLGQVREAYRAFHARSEDAALDRIFQDALALARRARRESGVDANLTSLSGIAARLLLDRVPDGTPLVVVGSGMLAGSVARSLGKRGRCPVRVTSRCPDNAIRLALEVGGFGAGLNEMSHLFRDAAGIVTATAAPHTVVYSHHLEDARTPLTIIDMGVPPDCDANIPGLEGVTYLGLDAIENNARTNMAERTRRAKVAARIIRDGAIAWARRR
jgi:glutamyl-tRNA reductase